MTVYQRDRVGRRSGARVDPAPTALAATARSVVGSLLVVAIIVVAVFLPTSSGGELPDVMWTIVMWVMVVAVIGVTALTNRIDGVAAAVGVWTLAYMAIITSVYSEQVRGADVSLARVAPIVALLFMACIRFKPIRVSSAAMRAFELMCAVLLLWNAAIISGVEVVKEFTANWFNQYQETALYYSMLAQKPVSAFGVHTYASYFYCLFFIVCLEAFKRNGRSRYMVFGLGFLVSTVFLTSQSSFVMLALMIGLLMLNSFRKPAPGQRQVDAWIPMTAVFGSLVLLLASSTLLPSLTSRYDDAFGSEINGVFARYSAGSFESNFLAMGSSLGIGFTIPEGVRFADSAYLVYFTMGHVFLLAGLYFVLVRFLWQNLPRSVAVAVILATLAFEAAAVATFSHRFTLIQILLCLLVVSLTRQPGEDEAGAV